MFGLGFEFPVGEMMMRGPIPHPYHTGATRLEYLKLLVATMVATPDEQAEYAALARPRVEAHWREVVACYEKRRLAALENAEKEIAQAEADLVLLRRVGAFDHVTKMEAVLATCRDMIAAGVDPQRCDPGSVRASLNFHGFPTGTGGDLIYELKYSQKGHG